MIPMILEALMTLGVVEEVEEVVEVVGGDEVEGWDHRWMIGVGTTTRVEGVAAGEGNPCSVRRVGMGWRVEGAAVDQYLGPWAKGGKRWVGLKATGRWVEGAWVQGTEVGPRLRRRQL